MQIPAGTLDAGGNEVPEGDYGQGAFERILVLPERTEAAAAFVSSHPERTDRMGKTIVFCVNQDLAARFVQAIANLNSDMVAANPFWAARITSFEGDRGKQLLEQFQDGDSPAPVVVTSSDLLTTGVDAPNVRTVVFFATVRSMARFKQMLGRGTRLDEERGKESFTVIDFTGFTAKFADPSFDGPPVQVIDADVMEPAPDSEVTVVDAGGDVAATTEVNEPEPPFAVEAGGELPAEVPAGVPADGGLVEDPDVADAVADRACRYVVQGRDVYVLASMLFVVEASDNFRLRAVLLQDWVRDRMLDLGHDATSLRAQWANATTRRGLTEALRDAIPLSAL